MPDRLYGMSGRNNKIQRFSYPMNDMYWTYFESVDDKCISLVNLRYVNYSDFINRKLVSFKRE